jgi:hypothetical protein
MRSIHVPCTLFFLCGTSALDFLDRSREVGDVDFGYPALSLPKTLSI